MHKYDYRECSWISNLSHLMLQGDDYVIFVANEFFDALPIRSFKVTALLAPFIRNSKQVGKNAT